MSFAMRAEAGLLWKRLVGLSLDAAPVVQIPSTGWVDRIVEPAELARHFRAEVEADRSFAVSLADRLRSARSVRIVVPDERSPVQPGLVDAVLEYVTAFAPPDAALRALVLPSQTWDAWDAGSTPWPEHLVRLASWEIPIDTDPGTLAHLCPTARDRPLGPGEVVVNVARPYRASRYRVSDPDLRLVSFSIGKERTASEFQHWGFLHIHHTEHPARSDEQDPRSNEGVFCVYETNRPSGYQLVVGSPRSAIVATTRLLGEASRLVDGDPAAYVVCADERPRYLAELARYFTMIRRSHEREDHDDSCWSSQTHRRVVVVCNVLPMRPLDSLVRRLIWGEPTPYRCGVDGDLTETWEEDAWLTGRCSPLGAPPGVRVSLSPSHEQDAGFWTLPTTTAGDTRHSRYVVLSHCGASFGTHRGYQRPAGVDFAAEVLRVALADGVQISRARPLTLARGLTDAELLP